MAEEATTRRAQVTSAVLGEKELSAMWTRKVKRPVVEVVPVIFPVEAFRLKPGGRDPLVIEKV
jgi:hypothetical protein